MADITCPRHRILSRHFDESGRPLCGPSADPEQATCFGEALAAAESETYDRIWARIQAKATLDQSSAAWLLTRLGWSE